MGDINRRKKSKTRKLLMSKRLLYAFILMTIVPLFVFATILYGISNQAMENKISNYSVQTLKAVNKMIDYECDKYERTTDLIMINKQVQEGLKNFAEMNPREKNEFIVDLDKVMSNYMSNQPDIMQIYLLDTSMTPIYNQGWFYFNPDKLKELAQNCLSGNNWLSVSEAKKDYIIYTKPVQNRNGQDTLGYISIHINPNAFLNCFSNMNLGNDSCFLIMDAFGHVVVSQNEAFVCGEAPDDTLFSLCSDNRTNPVIKNYKILNRKNMVVYTSTKLQKWIPVLMIPNTYLYDENKTLTITMLLCCLICIVVSVVTYIQIRRDINEPMKHLVELVRNAADHDFDQVILDDSKDELGYLGRTFGQLMQTMKKMMLQSEEEQKKQRELELNMLQAQINPHFLFNTLNSLRWSAMMSGAETVSNGLAALSTLLSNTIIDKNQYVTIDSELGNIESYVAIQRIRYGEMFDVRYEIEEELKNCYIIKFLL
ncbi:MAG: histidine kinase, partial [Acetatifactor sp.]|nr:histidine kinase [Acetatifactor sp.]